MYGVGIDVRAQFQRRLQMPTRQSLPGLVNAQEEVSRDFDPRSDEIIYFLLRGKRLRASGQGSADARTDIAVVKAADLQVSGRDKASEAPVLRPEELRIVKRNGERAKGKGVYTC